MLTARVRSRWILIPSRATNLQAVSGRNSPDGSYKGLCLTKSLTRHRVDKSSPPCAVLPQAGCPGQILTFEGGPDGFAEKALRLVVAWSQNPFGWCSHRGEKGERGQVQFAGTARRVLRTNWTCPLFPAPASSRCFATPTYFPTKPERRLRLLRKSVGATRSNVR